MAAPQRTVIVDGNCFWMEADSEGGYLLLAPVDRNGRVEYDNPGELDSRAFPDEATFDTFREAIRFLVTYNRG